MSIISDTKYQALNTRPSDADILPRKIHFPFTVFLLGSGGLLLTTANYLIFRVVYDILLQVPSIPYFKTMMDTAISKAWRTAF